MSRQIPEQSNIEQSNIEQSNIEQSNIILLIEEDDETRPLLVENLEAEGFTVLVTLNEEGAIARTRNGYDKPNVILINPIRLTLDESLTMGDRIRRQNSSLENISVVVIADDFAPALEGQDVEVNPGQYVCYPADGNQLVALLKRLC